MNIFNKNNYHFIGIGGIGISAIAKMLKMQGKKVSGSDSAESEITEDLRKLGIDIKIGQRTENIPEETEVVVYTIAIPSDNPEFQGAKKREQEAKSTTERTSGAKRGQESGVADFALLSYPQALGELSKNMFTIAVSGTHGKTTTTAMIAHILQKAGLDPTVIVGSKMLGKEKNSNFHAGKGKYLVVEACEYKRSFLNLSPKILVITNIEPDHLDYYKDLEDIKSAFRELKNKVPKDGFVITKSEYEKIIKDFALLLPGEHNIWNAQAAIKATEMLGIPQEKAKEFLKDFRGTWRRLEHKGEKDGAIFYDDYAHHPTEITASLSALRKKHPDRKLVAVFEPHQQSRTKLLFEDFVKSLSLADQVFIAPIYAARETPDPSISNKILADAVNKFVPAEPVENAENMGKKFQIISKPLCLILMGAGDIYKWTPVLLK